MRRVAPGDTIRDRDCATLRVAALAVDGLDLDAARQPFTIRYVPACARSPLALRVARAARDAMPDEDALETARRACDDAVAAAGDASRGPRAAAVAIATARLEAAQKGTWRWDSLDATPHPHRREKPSGRLSASAPPRIGVRSRAAYEAERLMQWATGRPSVTPVKASTVSPVPEPVVQTPPAAGVPAGGRLKKEVPATPPPAKAPFFSTPHHAEADVAAAASTRFRACWRRKGEAGLRAGLVRPALRELRVSAGAGPAAAPRVVPGRAGGRLRRAPTRRRRHR